MFIKFITAIALSFFGQSTGQKVSFWVQDQIVRDMPGVDERAALISALSAIFYIGLTNAPLGILIFRIFRPKVKKPVETSFQAAPPKNAMKAETIFSGSATGASNEDLGGDIKGSSVSNFRYATQMVPDKKLNGNPETMAKEAKSKVAISAEAQIHLAYNPSARLAFEFVEKFPASVQSKFFELLLKTPENDPNTAAKNAVAEALGIKPEQWTDGLEAACLKLSQMSDAIIEEFFRVYSTLSNIMTIDQLLEEVVKRSLGPVARVILLYAGDGQKKECVVYDSGNFSLPSTQQIFSDLNGVYNALDTPIKRRYPLYLYEDIRPKQ